MTDKKLAEFRKVRENILEDDASTTPLEKRKLDFTTPQKTKRKRLGDKCKRLENFLAGTPADKNSCIWVNFWKRGNKE